MVEWGGGVGDFEGHGFVSSALVKQSRLIYFYSPL